MVRITTVSLLATALLVLLATRVLTADARNASGQSADVMSLRERHAEIAARWASDATREELVLAIEGMQQAVELRHAERKRLARLRAKYDQLPVQRVDGFPALNTAAEIDNIQQEIAHERAKWVVQSMERLAKEVIRQSPVGSEMLRRGLAAYWVLRGDSKAMTALEETGVFDRDIDLQEKTPD